jgi:hypothetical protein
LSCDDITISLGYVSGTPAACARPPSWGAAAFFHADPEGLGSSAISCARSTFDHWGLSKIFLDNNFCTTFKNPRISITANPMANAENTEKMHYGKIQVTFITPLS